MSEEASDLQKSAFYRDKIILTNEGHATGQSVNNDILVNPLKDSWLEKTSILLAESISRSKASDFFGNASVRLTELYPVKNSRHQRKIRSDLISSSEKGTLSVGKIVESGVSPMCFEKIAVLHTAGAMVGYESKINSAFSVQTGKGHSWLEFEDSEGEWVVDPTHFSDDLGDPTNALVVSKEVAYKYFSASLGFDMKKVKSGVYVNPKPPPPPEAYGL
jgi:hypothetical protein